MASANSALRAVVLAAAGLGASPLAPAAAETLAVSARFEHSKAAVPYETTLFGRAAVSVETTANGLLIGFPLGLGEHPCQLALRTAHAPRQNATGATTASIEACLTAPAVDEHSFNFWYGSRRDDPFLSVPLAADLKESGRFSNLSAIRAQLFVRDCRPNAPRFRRYGDLTIAAGALVVARGDAQNGPAISLRAASVALENIDSPTWRQVVGECGNAHVNLPQTPGPGLSALLVAATPSPSVPDPVKHLLDGIRTQIASLVSKGALDVQSAMRLVRAVDDGEGARREGRAEVALAAIARLEQHASALVAARQLDDGSAQAILSDAGIARGYISDAAYGVLRVRRRAGCGIKEACVPAVLHVNRATTVPPADRDGTEARPYGSIAAALAAGAEQGTCAVTVIIAPGTYGENLVITRHTVLSGITGRSRPVLRGSVTHGGGFDLSIRHVAFSGTPGSALQASHPCGRTTLTLVVIDSALDYGIDVRAGAFEAHLVTVRSTRARESVVSSGVGIRLHAGARAAMTDVELTGNEGQALAVIGEETRALARGFVVRRNELLGGLVGLQAAVSALEGNALLLMESSVLEDNVGIGLQAVAARIHFRAGRIVGTREITAPERIGTALGLNAGAYQTATLELTSFTLSHGDLAGVQFGLAALGRMSWGEVTDHPIGAAVHDTPIDLNCMLREVAYRRNRANLDAESLPIPPRGTEPPPEPICATVPFDCDWCVGS